MSKREAVEACFKRWDLNGDGFISEEELSDVLVRLGARKEQVHECFFQADVNKDGRISYQEFLAYTYTDVGGTLRDIGAERKASQNKARDIPGLIRQVEGPSGLALPSVAQEAAESLANLTSAPSMCAQFVEAGGIAALIKLLRCGTPDAKESAAACLANVAQQSATNKGRITHADALPALVELAVTGTPGGKEQAARVLAHLADFEGNDVAIGQIGGVLALVDLAKSGTRAAKTASAAALAEFAWNEGNQGMIVDTGGLVTLIDLVANGEQEQTIQAARALANLACSDDNQSRIVEAGGISAIVRLLRTSLRTSAIQWQEQAARALANLAGNSGAHKEILEANIIPTLVQLTKSTSDEARLQGLSALRNLMDSELFQKQLMSVGDIIPWLFELLTIDSSLEEREHALGICAILAHNPQTQVMIVEAGVIPLLICSLEDGSVEGKNLAAQAISSIAMGNAELQAKAAEGKVIPALLTVIESDPSSTFAVAAAQALAALAKRNKANQDRILAANGMHLLLRLAEKGVDKSAPVEALSNLVALNNAAGKELVNAGGISVLVSLSRDVGQHVRTQTAWIIAGLSRFDEACRDIVKAAGGVPLLVELANTSGNEERQVVAWALAER